MIAFALALYGLIAFGAFTKSQETEGFGVSVIVALLWPMAVGYVLMGMDAKVDISA